MAPARRRRRGERAPAAAPATCPPSSPSCGRSWRIPTPTLSSAGAPPRVRLQIAELPLPIAKKSGSSFHVFDQGQFAKEVLPKYFKHNNMASFVRQLNMYGFRKVVHIEQGGLVKPEKDDTEFQHPYFIRGQELLLENIKRKVTSVSNVKSEDVKVRQDNVTKLLTDIQVMKGKQESMDSKLVAMKQYVCGMGRTLPAGFSRRISVGF
ncbi:heat shock factor protein 1-like isoform X1 [Manacus candei]|uniref:heat shock factor protein 1-like isoform X1 n=1 Tax=Manacus candei TaxID=415023 RepID=UPI002227A550|nr:heat shock factor protein 1-like isoform X1 [Manacus candei]